MKKNFVEINVPTDCEARHTEWVVAKGNYTYEELAEKVTGYGYGPYGVREVEKTFNEETFTITTKVLREKLGA